MREKERRKRISSATNERIIYRVVITAFKILQQRKKNIWENTSNTKCSQHNFFFTWVLLTCNLQCSKAVLLLNRVKVNHRNTCIMSFEASLGFYKITDSDQYLEMTRLKTSICDWLILTMTMNWVKPNKKKR